MSDKKVSTKNDFGERLIGIETTPVESKDKYATILLVHGFGVTKEEGGMFDDLADYLSQNGFLVYRFDFSGCGGSEGDYSETSLSKLKSDLSEILNFLNKQKRVDSSRLGILAQSLGTSVVVASRPEVRAIVLMGSSAHPKKLLSELFGENYNPDGISSRKRSSGDITHVKPGFWKDFQNYDLVESINGINCPILFIHGSKDEIVPLSEMEKLYDVFKGSKEKLILDGADHGLNPHREKMHEIVRHWFAVHLLERDN